MAIGWVADVADADAYFDQERYLSDCWDGLTDSGDTLKTKLLTHAFNRIFYDPRLSVPAYASATAAQLVILRKAQCEYAIYICQHLEDEDARKGIQAQGVIAAGIVKERYLEEMMMKIPIPPFVWGLLDGFRKAKHFAAVDLTRNEDESVN